VQAGGGAAPADCDTVKTRLAIAIVPVRAAPVVLAATRKVTLPFPLPVAPAVIVIHGTVLPADQAHPAAEVTVIGVPAPPEAPMLSEVGEMDASQVGGIGVAAAP
jgi:hypothetical protein